MKSTAPKMLVKAPVFDSLVSALDGVPDNRSDQGKKVSVVFVDWVTLVGLH